MNMAPFAESNVVGRHGQVGVEVLTHDLPLEASPLAAREIAKQVEEMDRRLAEILRYERTQAFKERGGEIALADTVSVEVTETPAVTEEFGLYL
jgi:hypothetical protein